MSAEGAAVGEMGVQVAPAPPFSLADYPMEPVTAASGNGWAQGLLGNSAWTLDPVDGGLFNPADQSVSSVNPPSTPGLLTVLAAGPTQEVDCVSYVCVTGPGASTVDVALYPESLVGGAQYLGWDGSSFELGPAIETNGCFWYRLAAQWEEPFPDPSSVFYAKTYRAKGAGQPFKLWAFKSVEGEGGETAPQEGNLACLFQCAEPGPFLRAQLTSEAGRRPLRVTYNWLYSALNCTPSETTPFFWDFIKTADGSLALSPSDHYGGRTLYASVRPDWGYNVQVQAPGSADWITAIGADEKLSAQATGILGAAFKGLNGSYIAVNETADDQEGHSGYRLRSLMNQLIDDCTFRISNATVLQEGMEFLEGYSLTEEDIRAAAEAYGVSGLSDDDIRKLAEISPEITPERLAEAHERFIQRPDELAGFSWAIAGAVVGGICWGVVGAIVAGPAGAAAGIALGAAIGAGIGSQLEPHSPHEDPTNTVNPANPSIARTLVNVQPQGGPYENRHLWEDLFRLTNFAQIGDAGLPDAGCVYPPASGNALQLWFPTRQAVGPSIVEPVKYPQIGAADGTVMTMSLFAIVQLKDDGRLQMRTHPDMALVNRPERPNHSQLTQGSRILALMGDDAMHVYGAGEMYVDNQGVIRGVTAKTGHYVNWTSTFDTDVFVTVMRVLQALGYSTGSILTGKDFWSWVNGTPWLPRALGEELAA
jgi:hypothetical protein